MENLSIYSRTPLKLEYAIWHDIKQRILYFLHIYKLVPFSFIGLFKRSTNRCKRDILKTVTVITCYILLRNIYPENIYHMLKVQSLIRVYVLFGVLELAEKLLGTLVDDFAISIDETFNIETPSNGHIILDESTVISSRLNLSGTDLVSDHNFGRYSNRSIENKSQEDIAEPTYGNLENIFDQSHEKASSNRNVSKFTKLLLILFFIVVTLFHTLILFLQYLIISLSLNSSTSVLYSLIISLQFMELKGNVTKKGDKNTLFVMIDNDGLKRFNLSLYLLIAFLMRFSETDSLEFIDLCKTCAIIFSLKISIDWIKHVFFCRYNKIEPSEYHKYKNEYQKRNNFVSHNALFLWLCDDTLKTNLYTFLFAFFIIMFVLHSLLKRIF